MKTHDFLMQVCQMYVCKCKHVCVYMYVCVYVCMYVVFV
jgi:hypothetical protein